MKVYLAGGMRSGWQDVVAHELQGSVSLIDPRTHGLKDETNYTSWDILGVIHADLVFAYLESDNPSGVGMAFEIGYAKAAGIPIIFVEAPDHPSSRYFGMCRASADFYCKSLSDGIEILNSLLRLPGLGDVE